MPELSSAQLLLDCLRPDLPGRVAALLRDGSFNTESLQYLNELFAGSSSILAPTGDTGAANQNNELVNEIAELDSAQNIIEDKLKKTVVASSGAIIESRLQLNSILAEFEADFVSQLLVIHADLEEAAPNTEQDRENATSDGEEQALSAIDFKALKSLNESLNAKSPLYKVLANIDSITDILELPSLAGACVKSGHYHETLEISSYTRRLAIRYPGVRLVKKVEDGVKREIEEMLVGLVKLLKTDLKQSNIVKIVSYLRRMYPFNVLSQAAAGPQGGSLFGASKENSAQSSYYGSPLLFESGLLELSANALLRRIYMQSRYQFIVGELRALAPLKEHSVEKYLKRAIELIREHCFSSIITYQSVFPNEDFNDGRQNSANTKEEEEEEECNDLFSENDELIHDFISNVMSEFTSILVENLPLVEEQHAKDSLILQIIYCSQSLGRVGGEFSSLVLSRVPKHVLSDAEYVRVLRKQRTLSRSFK